MKRKDYLMPTLSIIKLQVENVLSGSTDNVGYWKDDWFKDKEGD